MEQRGRGQRPSGRTDVQAGRAVGIKDVARHAGVSATTVSNVLNGSNRMSAATRERVLSAIETLGYVRNAAAHQLRMGSSGTVGLVVPDAGNPFYSAIARGAEDAAMERGGSVIVGNSDGSEHRESRYLTLFEQQRVSGVLIAPVGNAATRIEALRDRGVRAVAIGRVAQPGLCSSVSIDNMAGGYLAVQHLLSTGRSRIGFVGPPDVPGVGDRLAGTRQAMADAGLGEPRVLDPKGLTVAAGRDLAGRLVAEGVERLPDGIFCANDMLAIGMLHAFIVTGHLSVPDDVGLIGYDDIDFASSAIVPLSSIRQPAALIGSTAFELLQDEVEDPRRPHRHVMFPPELVVRRSTRR